MGVIHGVLENSCHNGIDARSGLRPASGAGHKVIAEMRARQTPGVFSVTNDLLVASELQQGLPS